MPRTTERVMRGCFPPVRRPALPSSSSHVVSKSLGRGTGTGSDSRPSSSVLTTPSSPVFVDDDDVLYPSDAEPARLSNAIASRRFFLAAPGRSNSIVDSAERAAPRPRGGLHRPGSESSSDNARELRRAATNAFPASAKPRRAPPSRLRYSDIHAVQVTSRAPRDDFLESMVEMADAMGLDPRRGAADVAALQELLLCYIAVNEHNALGDIIAAYAALLRLFGGNADGEGRDDDRQRR